jgi:hydrogenase expression/formation protein HypC
MCLGIPGRIVEIADVERKLAVVDISGVRRAVNVICIEQAGEPLEALIDRWVLIHVGFAMSIIDQAEAERTLDLLAELGEAEAELEAMRAGAASGAGA